MENNKPKRNKPMICRLLFTLINEKSAKIPKRCKCCELVGICRDLQGNGKCYQGCMIINNSEQEQNYD